VGPERSTRRSRGRSEIVLCKSMAAVHAGETFVLRAPLPCRRFAATAATILTRYCCQHGFSTAPRTSARRPATPSRAAIRATPSRIWRNARRSLLPKVKAGSSRCCCSAAECARVFLLEKTDPARTRLINARAGGSRSGPRRAACPAHNRGPSPRGGPRSRFRASFAGCRARRCGSSGR
jgi:hypothetical protein